MSSETLDFDVVIVGAGPAGLAAALQLAKRARKARYPLSVCVIDKAPFPGAHTLSGALLDPRALDELLPDWRARAPDIEPVSTESLLWLGRTASVRIPRALVPPTLRHRGQCIVRLGHLVAWLTDEAMQAGIEVIHGFAADTLLTRADGTVLGVRTGDKGLDARGLPGPRHQNGMTLRAAYTLFAEGCRGHLGQQLEMRFGLRRGRPPQHYALGLKELWRVRDAAHRPGEVLHTVGWPLAPRAGGGGFVYSLGHELVSVGLVVALDYTNPWLSPFDEFQRFKTHPSLAARLAGGERLAYGARALCHGGLNSLPDTVFPGGALIGDEAGFLDPARLQGIHNAMRSGMLAADACFEALQAGRKADLLTAYPDAVRQDWLYARLHHTRNFKAGMQCGLLVGAGLNVIEQSILRGHVPWTLSARRADHEGLRAAARARRVCYPRPDGSLSFDLASSLALSGVHHQRDQPNHLRLRTPDHAETVNLARYAGPEQRYCPAGVYSFVSSSECSTPRLEIQAENCLHCKTCDIKDPGQNIVWTPPQGGDGPVYDGM